MIADVQATFCATLVDEWVRAGVTDAGSSEAARATVTKSPEAVGPCWTMTVASMMWPEGKLSWPETLAMGPGQRCCEGIALVAGAQARAAPRPSRAAAARAAPRRDGMRGMGNMWESSRYAETNRTGETVLRALETPRSAAGLYEIVAGGRAPGA